MSAGKKNNRIALSLAIGVAGMVGMAYAAVPLYQIFCQVTGFGGTVQVAEANVDRPILERVIRVRFDTNTSRDIPWNFRPVERVQTLRVGEQGLAFFEAENLSDQTVTGTATFNVTPLKAGLYFSKIQCFCFTEQTLAPHQRADMPVTYFIDPAIADDPNLDDVSEITLSYTFFRAEQNDVERVAQQARDIE
jgi:cytochrome c oxidase assembly protein subunit 11